jgi:HEAT repeat protein
MVQRLTDLVEALGSDDGLKRKWAWETLTLLGEPAVLRLRELLSSGNKRIRWEAARGLAAMVDPGSVQAFVELLADEHSEVRWLAGSGLISLGPRSVVPVLESLIQHPDSLGHQQVARRVLRGLSSDNDVLKEIVRPVIGALEHSDPAVIATKAAVALNDLEKTTGVQYRMNSASSPEPQA